MDVRLINGITWTKAGRRGIANQRRHFVNLGLILGTLLMAATAGILWVAMVF